MQSGPLKLEPWQQEVLDRALDASKRGERVQIGMPPGRSKARSAFLEFVQSAMMHSTLYGCEIQVGTNDDGNVFWRCGAGDKCPGVAA